MHGYSIWQIRCVIFALTAARFLSNNLRVWESVVLRSQRTDLCAAMIQGSVYARWQMCCSEAVYRSAFVVACFSAVALFLLEFILLAVHNSVDTNPHYGTVMSNV